MKRRVSGGLIRGRRPWATLVITGALLSICGGAWASVMLLLPVPTLATSADVVVIGRVEKLRSEWNAERTRIYTHVDIRVAEVVHGAVERVARLDISSASVVTAAAPVVVVTVPGGVVDGIGMKTYGAPEFRHGEEALLFLRRVSIAHTGVVGWGQGKWTLDPGPAGPPPDASAPYDHRVVRPGVGGLSLVVRDPDGRHRPALPPTARTVADLKAEIRAAAAAGDATGGRP